MNCLVCKQVVQVPVDSDVLLDAVCGECNENLEGRFDGDHPTFYGLMGSDYAIGLQVNAYMSDKQVVGQLPVTGPHFLCPCPRDETRWNTGDHL